ncbi:MAG: N-acetylmuramoyl-L-alanine amidase [Reyranella sp.]|uniref:N-acetylmuramoyl-L-alanine amidase n=1 Tax=Reyranella sp. TaxID=1929291 RepID=UPI003D10F220
MQPIDLPSPNHAARPAGGPIDILVLHYTELPLEESLAILRDDGTAQRVSAHYVLDLDGTPYHLVPEERAAWHAGRSHWRGRDALNATSIGIEIVNLHGDLHDYPTRQIEALIELCHDIVARHPAIASRNVVGHSDIAPKRKIDPGRRFPWAVLAQSGIGLWPREARGKLEGDVQAALQRFGYSPAVEVETADIIAAFQRRFRPNLVDGIADDETRGLLADLLDQIGCAP